MIQRLLALVLLCCLPLPGMAAAEGGKAAVPPVAKLQKSAEQRYLASQACLQRADATCAQVELAGMPPNSPYAKLLEAQIAAAQLDYDTALRLLLPLQSNDGLPPQASASLHATLALAYENEGNILLAIGQLNLAQGEAAEPAYRHIWQLLEGLPHETLLELRGESPDSLTQGWIDLALAAHAAEPKSAIAQWRSAYPDHPAPVALLQQLAETAPVAVPTAQFTGAVALLLPLDQPAYAAAAEAVQAGLMAARGDAAISVKVYPSRGDGNAVVALYQQAVNEGAQYVVGPMVREEVNALAAAKLNMVPTLALNAPDQEPLPENFLTFGLPVEAEAMQVAQLARARGMQSAILVAADTPLSKRMEQAFVKEWKAQQGTVVAQESFTSEASLAALKADLANRQADMIFLAANFDQARLVRPGLDPATPTFAISHIYDGLEQDPENAPLNAIHFVDMPWLVNPDHPDFAPYREAAAKLPPGEAQRWFAVGVDAWHILAARAAGKTLLLPGLSGTLRLDGNTITRELSLAQFRSAGVVPELSN